MFTRILLPLDGSSRSEEVIPLVRQFANEAGAQVLLLHVDEARIPTPLEPDVARRLEAIAKEFRHANIEARVLALVGPAPTTIAATAEVHGVDLIVMAPESRGFLATLRHPSVTAGVLAKAPTATLIAPSYAEGPAIPVLDSGADKVIVPLDGSALAEQALPLAEQIAERYRRGLLLARVIPPIQSVMAGPGVYPLPANVATAEMRDTQAYLCEAKRRILQACHVPVEWVVLSGVPAIELLAFIETKPGSVVVMSTHGRSGLARFMLGSVALEIARKTTIPTFIVPAASASRGEPTTGRPEVGLATK
jgi:nucleotide-binding universal stress UspA family protein